MEMKVTRLKKLVKAAWKGQNDFLKYGNENHFRDMHDNAENWTAFKNDEEGD